MLRYLIVSGLTLLASQTAIAADETHIEAQLKKDKIDLSESIRSGTNPLQKELRPRNTPLAVDYEYHAWSEKRKSDEYPVYKWELVNTVGERSDYELTRYWRKLSRLDKENLEKNRVGALTHKSLRTGSDSESFLIFYKYNPTEKPSPAVTSVAPTKPEELPPPDFKTQAKNAPVCEPVPGKPGFVFSPTAKDKIGNPKMIDVRGLKSGAVARDPWNEKQLIRIP